MIINGSQSPVQQSVSSSSNSVNQDAMSEGLYHGKSVAAVPPAAVAKMPVLQRLARGEDGVIRFEGKTPVVSTLPAPATLPVMKQIVRPKGYVPRLQERTQAPETPPTLTRLDPWAGRVRTSSPMPDTRPAPPVLKRYQQHSGASLPTDYAKMPALIAIDEMAPEPMDVTESGRSDQNFVAANNVTSQMYTASEGTHAPALPGRATVNHDDPEVCEHRYPDTKHLTMEDIKEVRKWREDRLKLCARDLEKWSDVTYFKMLYKESIEKISTMYAEGSRMYELAAAECIEQYHTMMVTGLWAMGRSFAQEFVTITHEIRERTQENLLSNKKGSDSYLMRRNDAFKETIKKYQAIKKVIGPEYAAAEELYIQRSPQLFVGVKNSKVLTVHPELVSRTNKVLPTESISQHSAFLKSVRAEQ